MSSAATSTPNQTIGSDCEVTLSDQTLINRFARLNAKHDELQADVKKRARDLENVEEAMNELILADSDDGDGIYMQHGEVFSQVDVDGANQSCEDKKKSIEDEIAAIKINMDALKDEMSQIKVKLYAKFGSNINLEYDDDS